MEQLQKGDQYENDQYCAARYHVRSLKTKPNQNWVICVGEAGDGSSHTYLSAYDVTKTYVVGDDYQRHRWQCTTSLVSFLKLYLVLFLVT